MSDDEVEGTDPDVDPGADASPEQRDTILGCPVEDGPRPGQRVIHVERDRWREVAAGLLTDGWNMCVDLTAVDYLTYQGRRKLPTGIAAERFEVVAAFLSHERRQRIRARVQIPAEDPTIESLYDLFPGTDYQEREVFDLFGITFAGHPDMSRILMPETWDGHPLRKDYAVGVIPVQFKAPQSQAPSRK